MSLFGLVERGKEGGGAGGWRMGLGWDWGVECERPARQWRAARPWRRAYIPHIRARDVAHTGSARPCAVRGTHMWNGVMRSLRQKPLECWPGVVRAFVCARI